MVVKFECGAFIVGYHEGSSTKRKPMLLNSKCEVVGNIYDNEFIDQLYKDIKNSIAENEKRVSHTLLNSIIG